MIFDGTAVGKTITPGASAFYDLTINSSNGNGAWTTAAGTSLSVARDFTLTNGSLTLGNSLSVTRNVTLTAGTLDANGKAVSVGGNWERVTATFTPGGNTVTFN
ncbi:MAG: hypothetical protein EOM73_17175, partial [Bacteroidia bacterium]|nr:hypothetical protein [Bacteroidia bacterium]